MNAKDKQRLQYDLIKYCDQIGIYPEERPKLVFYKNEMIRIFRNSQYEGKVLFSDVDNCIGECFHDLRTIFIYSRGRHLNIEKMTYSHWLFILIHELVHYRFEDMRHDRVKDAEFLKRVREIMIDDKHFESVHIKAGCSHSSDVWRCWDCFLLQ